MDISTTIKTFLPKGMVVISLWVLYLMHLTFTGQMNCGMNFYKWDLFYLHICKSLFRTAGEPIPSQSLLLLKVFFRGSNDIKAGSPWHREQIFLGAPNHIPSTLNVSKFCFSIFLILYIHHLLLVYTPVFIDFDNHWNGSSVPVQILKRQKTDSFKIKSRNTFFNRKATD